MFGPILPPAVLNDIWLVPFATTFTSDVISVSSGIAFDAPVALSIPGIDSVQLVFGAAGDATIFEFAFTVRPDLSFTVKDVGVALRFSSDLLKPARLNTTTNAYEVDPTQTSVDIPLGTVTVTLDADAGVEISASSGITIPPLMIGDSGVVITASDIQLFLGSNAAAPGQPAGAKGVLIPQAQVFLPGSLGRGTTLTMQNAFIGNGGFTGSVSANIPALEEDVGGVKVTLNQVSLAFVQNALIDSTLTGTVLVPYFDKLLQVALTIGLDGSLALVITGVAPGNGTFDPSTGILTLAEGPLTFKLTRLELDLAGGKATFHGAGSITPVVTGVTFPTFEVKDFSIDSDGNLSVAGGWLDLPKHLSLSLFGFTLEITKLGFGTVEDPTRKRWVGFSGGLKLVDGFKAGASVDGLRVLWTSGGEVSLALDGVGVELEIPNAVKIVGSVSLKGSEFRGNVNITVASGLELGGQFVAGNVPGTSQKYFAVFVHAELPAGIPLATTGLAIYGAAGLYAHRMVPDKHADEGWYFNPDGSNGWYLRPGTPGISGVEDLAKWRGDSAGMGFGAGITLGTFADNGYSFNGRLLLVLSFPGPVIIIEGKANLLKQRSSLTDNPIFRALAIYDPTSSFLVSMDAKYAFRSAGELIDLSGSAEAFFDLVDPGRWHIWIGQKDPASRRVRARLFQLFDVNAYFMLDAHQLQIGAGWAFSKRYGFKHLHVDVGASLQADASVSWHPAHIAGSVALEGHAELSAFGFGLGLSVGASIGAEVFEPFHLKGDFHVSINLPWPLPDPGATITLEWGGKMTSPAPLPLPLQEASAEISTRGVRWPFLRGTNLVPNNDQGNDEFTASGPAGDPETLPGFDYFGNANVIPVDSQFGLSFSRPIDDANKIGNNPNPGGVGPEVIGDPASPAGRGYKVQYTLSSAILEKFAPVGPTESPGQPIPGGGSGTGWVEVAQKGQSQAPSGVPDLFGSWTPAAPPQLPPAAATSSQTAIAQTKLLVNAKSPFDYTALASQVWDQWFSQAYPSYPCAPGNPNQPLVANFEDKNLGTQLGQQVDGHFQFTAPAFDIQWEYGGDVTANEAVVDGVLGPLDRGLRILPMPLPTGLIFPAPEQVVPPPGTDMVRIHVGTPAQVQDYRHGAFRVSDGPFNILGDSLIVTSFRFTDGGDRVFDVPSPKVVAIGTTIEGLSVVSSISMRALRPPILVVELKLFGPTDTNPPDAHVDVQLFDEDGALVPGSDRTAGVGNTTVRIDVEGAAEVVLTASPSSTFLLTHIYARSRMQALVTTSDEDAAIFADEQDGAITVTGKNLGPIYLGNSTGGEFLILEIEIPSREDDVVRHTIAALAQFSQEGPVLEPETNYRLTVNTIRDDIPVSGEASGVKAKTQFKEQLYLRTAALPGIGVPALPAGTEAPPAGDGNPPAEAITGFEDLSFYVKTTVPAVPPPAGGHQTPARAVYRAYDQNVTFNDTTPYVELMYRLGRRDLSLRLFDANNQPIRGTDGRVIVSGSHWRPSEDASISSSAARWIQRVNAVSCAPSPNFKTAQALGSQVVSAPSEEMVLAPETLHQARLVPVLLHEAFVKARAPLRATGQGFQLDRWHAEQPSSTPSWRANSQTVTVTNPPGTDPPTSLVTTYFVTETKHVESALVYDGPLASVANTGHQDHPSKWQDYRASVQVRWQQAKVGFEVRRTSADQLLRLTLDRDTGARELVIVSGGQSTVLASDTPATLPTTTTDVLITIECVGDRVLVFQDIVGDPPAPPIFDVSGVAVFAGTVGLYTLGAVGLHFTEILVHDLRENPSTAFRFDFITSKYTNFFHHLNSADDQLFDAPDNAGLTATVLNSQVGAAVSVPAAGGPAAAAAAIGDDESRAFDALEDATLGSSKLVAPAQVEILRASHAGATGALLVRSPEPIDWTRTQLTAATAATSLALGVPGEVKLCTVAFSSDPTVESVALLLRTPASLAGLRIQWRPLPDATTPDPTWRSYFTFANDDAAGGTEVLVFSGAADTAPERAVGTTQRFVASSTATAAAFFPAAGVELRVLGADGSVRHQRQFIPDSAYAPFDAGVIRKRDGTAFFLFAAGGGALPAGAKALRLSLTFARQPGSGLPDLSQAGSTDPELANVEVSLEPPP